jgi:hypothetical protein
MTKTTVPIPKTGIDPDTPTTSTAQERRERKASGHEHMERKASGTKGKESGRLRQQTDRK